MRLILRFYLGAIGTQLSRMVKFNWPNHIAATLLFYQCRRATGATQESAAGFTRLRLFEITTPDQEQT
jgi:hypothetical protein